MEPHSHKVQVRTELWSSRVIKFRSEQSYRAQVRTLKVLYSHKVLVRTLKELYSHKVHVRTVNEPGHSRSCTAIKFRSGQSHGAVVSLAATHTELPRLVPYELDRLLLISSTRTRTLQRSFQETTRCALKLLECFGEIAPVPFWRFCSRLIEKSHCQTSPTDSVS